MVTVLTWNFSILNEHFLTTIDNELTRQANAEKNKRAHPQKIQSQRTLHTFAFACHRINLPKGKVKRVQLPTL